MAPNRTNRMGPARTKPKRNRMGESRPPSSTPLKPNARVGPNKRAQAVLRTATKPVKVQDNSYQGGPKETKATIKQPGLGFSTTMGRTGRNAFLSFDRTNRSSASAHHSAAEQKRIDKDKKSSNNPKPPKPKSVHTQNKDQLRGAAIRHSLGTQLGDVRPGETINTGATSLGRARVYDRQTNGVLKPMGDLPTQAGATKINNTLWRNHSGNDKDRIRRFDPKSLQKPLEDLARSPLVRATQKLPGGKLTQAALMINDASKHFTGKSLPDHERKRQKDKNDQLNKIKKNLFGK